MSHAALIIAVAGAVTLLLRFLPFLIFGGKRETPPYIVYLGKVLPYAIMGMLVIYCMRGISFTAAANFLPELIACAVVVLAHVWKRNTLLSIISGTVFYMLLVQFVF
ncbi:MAG: AzlD domain-containing protein [Candidatus Limivicinus sp.]|nr:AzlD domain-containing protein [Candidatus Limivicinus sp.]